jgi:hypothetical protein
LSWLTCGCDKLGGRALIKNSQLPLGERRAHPNVECWSEELFTSSPLGAALREGLQRIAAKHDLPPLQEEVLPVRQGFSLPSSGNETAQMTATGIQNSIRHRRGRNYAKSDSHRNDRLWSDIGGDWVIKERLPKHHLSDETKSTVTVSMAVVATFSALVLACLDC